MSNYTDKISIVLPVYNGAQYLRDAIDSCLNQTHTNFELIIVDDCSKDTTGEIVKSYTDPRIKYIRNDVNLRLPQSLNVGFRSSTGDYLTWTSDDNQFLPTALEEMLSYLKLHPNVDFVYTDMDVVNLKTGQKKFKPCSHWTFYFENIIGASYLYTRKVYTAIGEYDPRFEWVEDYEYWLRVEKKFNMRRLPKVLYLYGDHPQSLTSLKLHSVDFLAYVTRYYHGYLSYDGFVDAIGNFILKFLPIKRKNWEIWQPVIQKINRMDPKLRRAFWSGLFFALGKKFTTAMEVANRKICKKFKKDRNFLEILASLPAIDPQKSNVLCIIPFLTMGGSEKVMQDVIRGLTPKGYDFYLFCFDQDRNSWVEKFVSYFKGYIGIAPNYDVTTYTNYMAEIIRKLNIKMILITNSHMAYKSLENIKTLFPNIKVVDIIHLERVGGTHESMSKVAAPFVDRRVSISHHLLDYMKESYKQWGIPVELSQRLCTIHNGTDVDEFTPELIPSGVLRRQYHIPESKKIISFVARMADEKNPFIFIDIARGILAKSSHADVHFFMAGDGPLFGSVQSKIKDYGLEDFFTLPGVITNVAEVLRDSYLFFVVSTHEGIPLSIQESMLMQVPVISTQVGAIHEIIKDGVNGYLISRNEQTVDQAIDKAVLLLTNEPLYRQFAQNARLAADPEFTLNHMCAQYEKIFNEVLH